MAFNAEFLAGIGVDAEKSKAILDAHAETVAYYNSFREDAERTHQIEAEIEQLQHHQAEQNEWKEKYEAVHAEFSELKKREEAKMQRALKGKAYESVLCNVGVPSKLISLIMRSNPPEVDDVILDGDSLINEQAIKSQIMNEYSDFIRKPAWVRF